MVKRSLFARLFGRADSNGVAVETAAKPRAPAPPSPADRAAQKNRPVPAKPAAAPPPGEARRVSAPASAPRAPTPTAAPGPAPTSVAASPVPERAVEPVRAEADVPMAPYAAPPHAAPVKAQEMARDEELGLKLKQGFQGLSNLLTGIDHKIDRQQKTSEDLAVSVRRLPELIKDMPDASRAGLELLARISSVLESQGRTTSELLDKMQQLPQVMGDLEQRMAEQVANLAKSGAEAEKTARETQRQVVSAFADVRANLDAATRTQKGEQDRMQRELVDELRRSQSDQDRRVAELIQRSGNATKVVIFLLVVVLAALLLVVQQIAR